MSAAPSPRLALALMVASGFAALGYQIVWTQQATLWLGHEAAAVLAVVAGFFAGIGVGALALGTAIARSARPARWYATCEAVVGLWALALALLLAPIAGAMLALIGAEPSPLRHWAVAFGATFLLLLPATAAMGATLPAVARALVALRGAGASVAALYAANTFGAVLGVLATAFWLVPSVGLVGTAGICAVLSLAAAAAALRALPDAASSATVATERTSSALPLLAATGFLGIGYEVVVVRVLAGVTENTVYTFAILLAVYLVGTALGAAAYAKLAARADAAESRDRLLRALAASCLIGALVLTGAEPIKTALSNLLGTSMAAALAVEAALATVAFLLPTLVMGALFSHLATAASATGGGVARAIGINTLGAAVAPLAFGIVLIPGAGSKLALLLVAAGYLALSSRRAWRTPTQWAAVAAVAALVAWAPPPARVGVPAGGRLVSAAEGVMATVVVVEDAGGTLRLHVDNGPPEGSSATLLADSRQALLPLLLHAVPRRALFLGLGTGITAGAAADDASVEVTAVELLPEVIDAAEHFSRRLHGEPRHPHLRVLTADARRFVRATARRYDVVVADNFHPARSGSGSLYTLEHFVAVRARLADGGLFCQWLPLHQLDLDTLRSIVQTFLAVYPRGTAILATYSLDTPVLGLVAHGDGGSTFDREAIRRRLAAVRLPHSPAELGIDDDLALFGTFVAGPHALAAFAGSAPLNTDDRPVVAYRAPRLTYEDDSLPRDRLVALLRELSIGPDDVVDATSDTEWNRRLAAYWAARDAFMVAGRGVEPTPDVRRMLAQVREPLLGVLKVSPDFRPAYDPLLNMALALARVDAAGARDLLVQLQHLRERPEVAHALLELDGAPP